MTTNNTGQITIDLVGLREGGIFIMMPTYAGQAFTACFKSLIQLAQLCTMHSIPLDFFFIYNESLIPRARNYSADEFLRRKFRVQDAEGNVTEKYYEHGMFIDADIEFNPIDVLVMAHLQRTNKDYDIICGPYSKKAISWEKVKEAVDKGLADDNPENLENYIGDFVFNSIDNRPITISKPTEVAESGTGFMMFRRETLLKVAQDNPNIAYLPDHRRIENFDGTREVYAFFDCVIDPETKRYLSEDYYFCKLSRKSGLKVWLVPWIELKHHGYFVYGGTLAKLAQANLSATTDMSKIKKKKFK